MMGCATSPKTAAAVVARSWGDSAAMGVAVRVVVATNVVGTSVARGRAAGNTAKQEQLLVQRANATRRSMVGARGRYNREGGGRPRPCSAPDGEERKNLFFARVVCLYSIGSRVRVRVCAFVHVVALPPAVFTVRWTGTVVPKTESYGSKIVLKFVRSTEAGRVGHEMFGLSLSLARRRPRPNAAVQL